MKSMSDFVRKAAGVAIGAAMCVGMGFIGTSTAQAAGCTPGTSTIAECFADSHLATAVAKSLSYDVDDNGNETSNPDTTRVLTEDDSDTYSLDLSDAGITDLTGLEVFTRLSYVDLSNSGVAGATPNAITNVGSLASMSSLKNADASVVVSGGAMSTALINQLEAAGVQIDNSDEAAPANVTLTFDANGGTVGQASMTVPACTATEGGNANCPYLTGIPSPTREGYVFRGWYTVKNGDGSLAENSQFNGYTPLEDETLYAKWLKAVNIVFDANGGNFPDGFHDFHDSAKYSETSGEGERLFVPSAPTRSGYKFVGWATDKDGKNVVDPTKVAATGDVVYYAKWTADPGVSKGATGNAAKGELANTGSVVLPVAFTGVLAAITAAAFLSVKASKRRV